MQAAEQVYTIIKTLPRKIYKAIIYVSFLLSLLASVVLVCCFLAAASVNYPGAIAVGKMKQYLHQNQFTNQTIHLDASVTMNGFSRFVQYGPDLHSNTFSKEEYVEDYKKFDFVLTESPETMKPDFSTILAVEKFSHMNFKTILSLIQSKNFAPLTLFHTWVTTEPYIYIMRRNPNATQSKADDSKSETEPESDKVDEITFSDAAIQKLFESPSNFRPNLKWSQNAEKFTLTTPLYRGQVHHRFSSRSLIFYATETKRGRQKSYSFSFQFLNEIDPDASTIVVKPAKVTISIVKKQSGFWSRLLLQKKPPPYLKISWEDWEDPPQVDDWVEKDEDEIAEEEEARRLSQELKKREAARQLRLKRQKSKIHPTSEWMTDIFNLFGLSISYRKSTLTKLRSAIYDSPQMLALYASYTLFGYIFMCIML